MSSIKLRLTFLVLFFISSQGYIFTKGFESYQQFVQLQSDYTNGYAIIDRIESLNVKLFNEKDFNYLQEQRKNMSNEKLKAALSDVIQFYSDKKRKVLRKKVREYKVIDKQYHAQLNKLISFHEEQIRYFGVIFGSLWVLSLLLIYYYTVRSTFKPIKVLYKRMLEFLNNRYTYEFTVPNTNEVGNLHATFNSLAQRVLKNMDELKSLDKAKSEFLSIASHELRTPLTSIKGSLSLLKMGMGGQLDDKASNLMHIAEVETDRLIRLINDLLDLAKIEAGKFPLKKDWCSLNEILNQTKFSMDGLCNTANVPIELSGIPSIDIFADKDRIQQVLTNFLSNAIKYNPEGKSVKISIEIDPQEQLYILVSDQGIGITPEDQEIIFQKFRQSTGPNNPLVKGTGLGLAIAKALVEEHNGEINVRSKPNEGATFYFTLRDWRYQIEKEESQRIAS